MLSLWFCFLLHSILFLISQTSYRTYKIISSYELARPIMGTIFLVINHMRGLYGFMNRVQTERWFITIFITRKYCVLSRYVANNYINVSPANTFFNDAYQTISDIQFIATDRVAPVMDYKYIYIIYMSVVEKNI